MTFSYVVLNIFLVELLLERSESEKVIRSFDTLTEWLTWLPAKQFPFGSASSSLAGVFFFLVFFLRRGPCQEVSDANMEIPIDLEITKDIESQIAFLSNKNGRGHLDHSARINQMKI